MAGTCMAEQRRKMRNTEKRSRKGIHVRTEYSGKIKYVGL
jgi:hypothetical protein